MHGGGDVVVPVLSDGAAVADLAVDRVGLDERRSSDYARLPLSPAMVAGQRVLVDHVVAVLAPAHRQGLPDAAVHVDAEHPVSDLVPLIWADDVLLRKWNLER